MKSLKVKHFLIWFSLGLYLLFGLIGFNNSNSCFAANAVKKGQAYSTNCPCYAYKSYTAYNNTPNSIQANCPNCKHHCIKSPPYKLANDIVVKPAQPLADILSTEYIQLVKLITFFDNPDLNISYDQPISRNDQLLKLRTIILLN